MYFVKSQKYQSPESCHTHRCTLDQNQTSNKVYCCMKIKWVGDFIPPAYIGEGSESVGVKCSESGLQVEKLRGSGGMSLRGNPVIGAVQISITLVMCAET